MMTLVHRLHADYDLDYPSRSVQTAINIVRVKPREHRGVISAKGSAYHAVKGYEKKLLGENQSGQSSLLCYDSGAMALVRLEQSLRTIKSDFQLKKTFLLETFNDFVQRQTIVDDKVSKASFLEGMRFARKYLKNSAKYPVSDVLPNKTFGWIWAEPKKRMFILGFENSDEINYAYYSLLDGTKSDGKISGPLNEKWEINLILNIIESFSQKHL